MKALVIAPQPFYSPRGTPLSVYYRTLVMAELGVEIDFLTYGEGQDVDIPGVRFIRIPRFAFLGNAKVGPSYLKLFLDIFIISRMMMLLIRNRYDFVHAHEEAIFFSYFLKPIFRYKLVYDMHSSLPQQLTNFKFTNSKFIIRTFKALEDACLRKSDAIITICPDLYNYVNTIIRDQSRHFLIENSIIEPVRLKNAPPKEDSTADYQVPNLEELKAGKKLLVYAGTLEEYQGIDILIEAFQYVHEKVPETLLLIVGGRPDQVERYSALAQSLRLGDAVIFTGRVPQLEAKYYTNQADVLLSPRSSGTNTPLKVYEQLASGIPLVATDIYSHTQVLTPEVAFLVKPEPRAMGEGILACLHSNGETNRKVENARRLYEEKYSRKVYTEKIKQLLDTLR